MVRTVFDLVPRTSGKSLILKKYCSVAERDTCGISQLNTKAKQDD